MVDDFAAAARTDVVRADLGKVVQVLDEFCAGVGKGWNERVRCWRTRGFLTNLGQEWRVMMASAAGGPEHVMLRAHVAPGGFPVRLDLYEEELVECADEAALREALKRFLQDPTTRSNLELLASG